MTDKEEKAKTPDQGPTITPSFLSRRLHKFGQPDLEVVIGSEQHLIRVHSFMMASVSDYVDTLLSSPAASASQRMQLTFPDIPADTWNKMIRFLEPRCVDQPNLDDMLEILPLYDKYQFHSGIAMCDFILKSSVNYLGRRVDVVEDSPLYELISVAYHMEGINPDTKNDCKKWASRCLENLLNVNERTLRYLLPLVENDEKTLKDMCSTFLGKECPRNMAIQEMRAVVRGSTFLEDCAVKCNEIRHIDHQVDKLQAEKVSIGGCSGYPEVNREYHRVSKNGYYVYPYDGPHSGGAARFKWEATDVETSLKYEVEAVDVYGLSWEISRFQEKVQTPEGDDENKDEQKRGLQASKQILYRWNSRAFNSLVPPIVGWSAVNGGFGASEKDMTVSYSFESRNW